MNYRHAFHAGNHADVLKHVVLLALLRRAEEEGRAVLRRWTPMPGAAATCWQRRKAASTGEADAGILPAAGAKRTMPDVVDATCARWKPATPAGALIAYPGSPLLLAQALREQDRIAACELQPEEAAGAEGELSPHDARVAVHARDGYARDQGDAAAEDRRRPGSRAAWC